MAGLLHLIVVSWIGATGAAEVIVKLLIFALCVLASIFVAVAIDGFLIKPILAILPNYQDEGKLAMLLQQIRNVVAAIITLAGLVLAIVEVF